MGFYDDRVLPRLIDVVMNTKQSREIRQRVCADLKGDVLEIGFGTGHNLPFMPPSLTKLLAVEPSQRSVDLARKRIDASPFAVEVVGLDGQQLPVETASVDAVLCTWSLCTIPDPVLAVQEARRVLRPGGTSISSSTGERRRRGSAAGRTGSTTSSGRSPAAATSTATSA